MQIFVNSVILARDPSSSHLCTSAVYPKRGYWLTTYLICSIGPLLFILGDPEFPLVTNYGMSSAVLNPLYDLVLNHTKTMWNALSLHIPVESLSPSLRSLVSTALFQREHLGSYFATSVGIPLIWPSWTVRWMYSIFLHPKLGWRYCAIQCAVWY